MVSRVRRDSQSGGLIPPLSHNTPGFRGKKKRGEGEGGERKGRDPQGLVDIPMFQILKNTLKGGQGVLHIVVIPPGRPIADALVLNFLTYSTQATKL